MTDPNIDRHLFPAIYTDGERYYTVSDGQVWRWVYVSDGLFGLNHRKAHWYARRLKRMPADARYACRTPAGLQQAVQHKGGELHRYDLHDGQPHLSEEFRA